MILQAGRDNFAGARTGAVDEADHRKLDVAAVRLAEVGSLGAVARPDRDDQPILNEQVRDLDGAVEQTAGVEAQAKEESFDAGLAQLPHGVFQVAGGIFRELSQTDIADLVLGIDDVVPGIVGIALVAQNAFDLDPATKQVEFDRLLDAFTFDDELDL